MIDSSKASGCGFPPLMSMLCETDAHWHSINLITKLDINHQHVFTFINYADFELILFSTININTSGVIVSLSWQCFLGITLHVCQVYTCNGFLIHHVKT